MVCRAVGGRLAAPTQAWQAESFKLGLLDPKRSSNANRALFSKNRTQLIAANWIACDGDLTWAL